MLSKQYSLSTKYSFSFVLSGLALVLSSVLKLWQGEGISWISFALSIMGAIFAIIGAKLKYDDYDEMAEQHLNKAGFITLWHVIFALIGCNVVLKGSEIIHRFYNNFPVLKIQFTQDVGFFFIGMIFISMGYHFIQYEKYGEE